MRDKFQTILRIEEMIKSHRYDAYTTCVLTDAFALLGAQEEPVVHCKDCIYKPIAMKGKHGTYYVFPEEGKCPCQCDDDWYSWKPDDDWFCGNGVSKNG